MEPKTRFTLLNLENIAAICNACALIERTTTTLRMQILFDEIWQKEWSARKVNHG